MSSEGGAEGGAEGMSVKTQKPDHTSLDVFPLEVWETIFDNISNSMDWLNLYRSSGAFEDAMRDKRKFSFFPEVLRLVSPYLQKSDVLKCRLVCKKWKTAVEDLSDRQLRGNDIGDYSRNPLFFLQHHVFQAVELKTVEGFLSSMENFTGNPFPGRVVCFMVTQQANMVDRREHDNFWVRCIELLEKFGKEIRYFGLSTYLEDGESMRATLTHLKRISDCLKHLPNIEGLYIMNCAKNFKESNNRQILSFLEEYPLPKLPKLIRLNVVESSKDYVLLKTILNQCVDPQTLTQVHLQHVLTEAIKKFPHIQTLCTSFDPMDIRRLQGCTWNLQTISLLNAGPDLRATFKTLEKFAPTLRKIALHFEVNLRGNMSNLKLNLPQLRDLEIIMLDGTLDFLVDPSNLERMRIHLFRPDLAEYFYDDREMYRSETWKRFPKLRVFRFGTMFQSRIFLRESYLWYRQRYGYP